MGIENIQYYAQKSDFDCGVGAAGIVLKTFGFPEFDHEQAMSELKTSEDEGTDPRSLISFFKARGLGVRMYIHASSKLIREQISKGGVCIGVYQNSYTPSQIPALEYGHYGIIARVARGVVKIVDPNPRTGQFNLSRENFWSRMVDIDRYGNIIKGGVLIVKRLEEDVFKSNNNSDQAGESRGNQVE